MRASLIAIVLCFLTGLYFHWSRTSPEAVSEQDADPGRRDLEGWVYATKDIPENSIISIDDIAVKPAGPSNVPGLIASRCQIAGLRAKYGMSTGQIFSVHDVELPNKALRKKMNE